MIRLGFVPHTACWIFSTGDAIEAVAVYVSKLCCYCNCYVYVLCYSQSDKLQLSVCSLIWFPRFSRLLVINTCCWGKILNKLVVMRPSPGYYCYFAGMLLFLFDCRSEKQGLKIHIYDGRSTADPIHVIETLHFKPVTLIRVRNSEQCKLSSYNAVAKWITQLDKIILRSTPICVLCYVT